MTTTQNSDQDPVSRTPWLRSLASRVTLCSTGLLLIAATAMTAVSYGTSLDVVEDAVLQRLRGVAGDRAKAVAAFVSHQGECAALVTSRTRLRSLIQSFASGELPRADMQSETRRILDDVRQNADGFLHIWVCDSTGHAITATDDSFVGRDYSATAAFQQGRRTQYMDEPQWTDGGYQSHLSAPAQSGDGDLLGVIIILLDATPLVELIADSRGLGDTSEFIVAVRNGDQTQYLVPAEDGHRPSGTVSALASIEQAFRRTQTGPRIIEDFLGREVLAAAQPISLRDGSDRDWEILTTLDTEEALQPVRQMVSRFASAAVVFIGFFGLATYVVAARAVRPLRELSATAQEISAGRHHSRVAEDSSDECGVLAKTFNGMLDHLGGINTRLQQEVEERTCRLTAILNGAADGIITIDRHGSIESVNKAAEQMFGYSADELLNSNISMLMPSPIREEHDHYIARYLSSGGTSVVGQRREVEGLRKDGSTLPLELKVTEVTLNGQRMFVGCLTDISDRKQAHAELELSESRFRLIAEHVDDVLWMFNADGSRCEYISPAYSAMTGRSTDSLYQNPRDWLETVHPDDRERVVNGFREAARYGWDDRFRVFAGNGGLRWLHVVGFPIQCSEGQVHCIAGVTRDVTERMACERHLSSQNRELAEKDAFQRAILSSVSYAIIATDLDGVITSYNAAAEQMYGYVADEVIGKATPEIFHDKAELAGESRVLSDNLDHPVEPGLAAVLAGVIEKGVDEREWTAVRKDGSRFPICLSLSAMRDDQGTLTGFLGIAHDISSRKAAEQKIRESEQFVRRVLDSLACFAGVTDPQGAVLMANQAAREATGMDIGEYVGMPLDELEVFAHDADLQLRIQDAIRKAARGERCRFEAVGPVASGKMLTFDFQLVPLRDENGEVTHLIPSAIDLSDRVRYERRLTQAVKKARKANQAKSQFLASMSHDLRTPLNGVIGMTELLLASPLNERQKQFADACQQSGRILLALINDILDLSRIEAGKLQLDECEFNLEQLVVDTVDTFAFRVIQKELELVCHVDPPSRCVVRGDNTRVQQVIVNLVGNAVKFTDSGEITIRTQAVAAEADRMTVRISVSDTGIGIPREKHNRLFKPFIQASSSTTRDYGGTGLGLAICQRLVHMMGGRIGVESVEGQGSTFWFEVPFVVVSPPEPCTCHSQPVDGRMLIVDDNETNRVIAAEYASELGDGLMIDSVACVSSALSAIESAEAAGTPFDIVMTDFSMPGSSGLDLARALKDRPVQVALLSGSVEIEMDRTTLRSSGVAAQLAKPIQRQEYQDVIQCLLNSQRGDSDLSLQQAGRASEESAPPASCLRCRSEDSHKHEAVSEVQPADVPAAHILLAEDNFINQMYMKELLKQLGCTCDTAADGRDAVEAVRNVRYDLVLMDCQMPEMDGFEATREIRSLESAGIVPAGLPIVALTANAIKGDREKCLDAGMDAYLSKPVDTQQIVETLQQLLASGPDDSSATEPPGDQPLSTDDSPPIDVDSLVERCFGNLKFAASLLEEIEATGNERVAEIRQHAKEQDPDAAAGVAHALKSAAGILCMESVASTAAEIERAGRSADLDRVNAELDHLQSEMQRCLNYLPQLRHHLEQKGGE